MDPSRTQVIVEPVEPRRLFSVLASNFSQSGQVRASPVMSQLASFDATRAFVNITGRTGSSFNQELWLTDGTADGTLPLAVDLKLDTREDLPISAKLSTGQVVFAAETRESGMEPWISDGTAAGTVLLSDIAAAGAGSNPRNFISAGGRVFFVAESLAGDAELYLTDGTANGTRRITDFKVPAGTAERFTAEPTALTAIGGELFFAVPADNEYDTPNSRKPREFTVCRVNASGEVTKVDSIVLESSRRDDAEPATPKLFDFAGTPILSIAGMAGPAQVYRIDGSGDGAFLGEMNEGVEYGRFKKSGHPAAATKGRKLFLYSPRAKVYSLYRDGAALIDGGKLNGEFQTVNAALSMGEQIKLLGTWSGGNQFGYSDGTVAGTHYHRSSHLFRGVLDNSLERSPRFMSLRQDVLAYSSRTVHFFRDGMQRTGTVGENVNDYVVAGDRVLLRSTHTTTGRPILQVWSGDYRVEKLSGAQKNYFGLTESLDLFQFNDPTLGRIQGTLYRDRDNDAQRDSDETVVSGVLVYADSNGNARVDAGEPQSRTDIAGRYTLANVPVGRRQLRVKAVFAGDQIGDGVVTAASRAGRVTRLDLGLRREQPTAAVRGNVFADANRNGLSDAGEQPLVGVRIFLDHNRNELRDRDEEFARTDENGDYVLDHLPPEDYRVRVTAPLADQYVTSRAQYDFSLAGDQSATANFLLATDTKDAVIRGRIFADSNGDRVYRNADDHAYTLRRVSVYRSDDFLFSQHSYLNERGEYEFTGLSRGTYKLTIADDPFSSLREKTVELTIDTGQSRRKDFALSLPSVHGVIFNDSDADGVRDPGETGVAGVGVYLDANNDKTSDYREARATTDSSGYYRLRGVISGNTVVRTGLTDDQFTKNSTLPLQLGATGYATANFGVHTAAIQVTVFHDVDKDGKKDIGELIVGRDAVIRSTATQKERFQQYDLKFNHVAPGEWIVWANGTYQYSSFTTPRPATINVLAGETREVLVGVW